MFVIPVFTRFAFEKHSSGQLKCAIDRGGDARFCVPPPRKELPLSNTNKNFRMRPNEIKPLRLIYLFLKMPFIRFSYSSSFVTIDLRPIQQALQLGKVFLSNSYDTIIFKQVVRYSASFMLRNVL